MFQPLENIHGVKSRHCDHENKGTVAKQEEMLTRIQVENPKYSVVLLHLL
jgi:hypothetical protein